MPLPFVEIFLISIQIFLYIFPSSFLWFKPSFRLSFHFSVFLYCVFFAGIAYLCEKGFYRLKAPFWKGLRKFCCPTS